MKTFVIEEVVFEKLNCLIVIKSKNIEDAKKIYCKRFTDESYDEIKKTLEVMRELEDNELVYMH